RSGDPSGSTVARTAERPPALALPPEERSRSRGAPHPGIGSRCPCPFHLASDVRKRHSLPWGKLLASLPGEVNVWFISRSFPFLNPLLNSFHKKIATGPDERAAARLSLPLENGSRESIHSSAGHLDATGRPRMQAMPPRSAD